MSAPAGGESKWMFKGVPCPDRMYCGNGGTCTYFPKLSVRACNCAEGFEGERCELTSMGVLTEKVTQSMTSDQDILRIFLFISNCLILFTLIAILIILCRRTKSRNPKRRSSPEDQMEAGPLRMTRIRRAIGWTFRRDVSSKPEPAPAERQRLKQQPQQSRWTTVRETMVPSLSDLADVSAPPPSASFLVPPRQHSPMPSPRRSKWTTVRETMVPSLDDYDIT